MRPIDRWLAFPHSLHASFTGIFRVVLDLLAILLTGTLENFPWPPCPRAPRDFCLSPVDILPLLRLTLTTLAV